MTKSKRSELIIQAAAIILNGLPGEKPALIDHAVNLATQIVDKALIKNNDKVTEVKRAKAKAN